MLSTHAQILPDTDTTVTHISLSDGLTNVSVFVQQAAEEQPVERARVGATHSYSYTIDGHVVTAVGDVPAATVERIARSMQPE